MSRIARNQMETTFFHNMTQGINKEYILKKTDVKRSIWNYCKKKRMKSI